jgi:hypothetical protein
LLQFPKKIERSSRVHALRVSSWYAMVHSRCSVTPGYVQIESVKDVGHAAAASTSGDIDIATKGDDRDDLVAASRSTSKLLSASTSESTPTSKSSSYCIQTRLDGPWNVSWFQQNGLVCFDDVGVTHFDPGSESESESDSASEDGHREQKPLASKRENSTAKPLEVSDAGNKPSTLTVKSKKARARRTLLGSDESSNSGESRRSDSHIKCSEGSGKEKEETEKTTAKVISQKTTSQNDVGEGITSQTIRLFPKVSRYHASGPITPGTGTLPEGTAEIPEDADPIHHGNTMIIVGYMPMNAADADGYSGQAAGDLASTSGYNGVTDFSSIPCCGFPGFLVGFQLDRGRHRWRVYQVRPRFGDTLLDVVDGQDFSSGDGEDSEKDGEESESEKKSENDRTDVAKMSDKEEDEVVTVSEKEEDGGESEKEENGVESEKEEIGVESEKEDITKSDVPQPATTETEQTNPECAEQEEEEKEEKAEEKRKNEEDEKGGKTGGGVGDAEYTAVPEAAESGDEEGISKDEETDNDEKADWGNHTWTAEEWNEWNKSEKAESWGSQEWKKEWEWKTEADGSGKWVKVKTEEEKKAAAAQENTRKKYFRKPGEESAKLFQEALEVLEEEQRQEELDERRMEEELRKRPKFFYFNNHYEAQDDECWLNVGKDASTSKALKYYVITLNRLLTCSESDMMMCTLLLMYNMDCHLDSCTR